MAVIARIWTTWQSTVKVGRPCDLVELVLAELAGYAKEVFYFFDTCKSTGRYCHVVQLLAMTVNNRTNTRPRVSA